MQVPLVMTVIGHDRPGIVEQVARLEIVGQDRPGIVRQISHALAAQQVNVEEPATECCSAPMSGETLFKAQPRLQIPAACDVGVLRQQLEQVASDLLVDISFVEVKDGPEAKARQAAREGPAENTGE